MKKLKNKKVAMLLSAIFLAVLCFVGTNLLKMKDESATDKAQGNPTYLELRVGKKEILVSSTDGTKNRQMALLGNLQVSFTDADGENSGWFRATEKNGIFEGDANNFSYKTEDGYNFFVTVEGTTVQATVTKDGAWAAITFTMNTHVKEAGKENSTPSSAVGFDKNLTEEEKNEIRQEVAKDNNATDVDENGAVVGIQKPENIWTADKAQDSVDKGEATIVPSKPTEEGKEEVKTDVITKDDEGYHLEEVRPESNPKPEPETKKEEKKEEVKQETPSKESSKEESKAPIEPQPVVKQDEEKVEDTPVEQPEQPKQETKVNTYERVSILVSKGNVISAFSENGGSGKLNLIVDSIDGNVYTCHTKDGAAYTVTIENGVVSFNGETYAY